jgi:hypothetical protein
MGLRHVQIILARPAELFAWRALGPGQRFCTLCRLAAIFGIRGLYGGHGSSCIGAGIDHFFTDYRCTREHALSAFPPRRDAP